RHGLAPSDPDGVSPRGWQAYLEGRAGHDSNVNSATATSQVAIPALGGQSVTLDPSGTRPQAGFLSIAGGIDLRAPLAHALSLSANAAASRLAHRHEDRFDTATLDAGVGLAWARGPDRVDLALQANRLRLDDRRFRDVAGVVAQWQHAVAPDTRLTAFAQQARLSYPSQPVRDADRGVVGVSVLQAFPASGRTTYASAYAGREDERAGSVPHLGHSLAGLRIGLQWPTVGAGTLYVDAAHERRRHGGPEPSFLAVRRDQQFSISAGLH
ncbi:MAG: surface lipoprotein assembly modifier, partial [bacterium]